MNKICSIFAALGLAASMFPAPASAQETVDIQFSLCDSAPENVLRKVNESDAKVKQDSITYYDSAPPSFIQDGVTFRVKRGGKKDESSLKIRFPHPVDLGNDYDCEFDRYGRDQEYTCELAGKEEHGAPIWSKEQADYLARYHGDHQIPALQSFGPYTDRKWKFKDVQGFKGSFDSVDVPGVGHLMELSVKVSEDEADRVQADVLGWLQDQGVKLCDIQESKTKRLFRAMGSLK